MKLRFGFRSSAFGIIAVGTLVLTAAGPGPRRAKNVRQGAVTDHVIVISVDGLRPDAIDRYGAVNLQRLRAEGTYAANARTFFPSKTLPSHVSMLTGVSVDVHGITWNNDRTGKEGMVKVETVFEIAKTAGYSTAAFFSKAKFRHFNKPGTLDHSQAPRGVDTWMATRTVGDAINYLRHRQPNLLFVHIGEPDYAGHSVGWMSAPYGWAVRRADGAVGKLLEAADRAFGKGEYTVIVTSDHGGRGRDHGTEDALDMTITWMVAGEGVSRGAVIPDVKTSDTAATVLWLLGVRPPASWTGVSVASAFTDAAQLASLAATKN